LTPFDYQDLVQRLERGDDSADTLRAVRQWLRPMMAQVLGMHARTVHQVARRLGKEIETRILDNGLRLPSDEMRPFLGMLGHLVRNAADHGIESPGERERAGKPRGGQIIVESRLEGPELVIAIEDDGRGIDWDAVRAQAERRALPATSGDDLVEALFFDGLSTRGMVTEISGRGIGLGAVRAACRQLGGTVRVASGLGRGTRIEFRFASPKEALAPAAAGGRPTAFPRA
jgi:two-component system chemotaxis sensor kinase CheA